MKNNTKIMIILGLLNSMTWASDIKEWDKDTESKLAALSKFTDSYSSPDKTPADYINRLTKDFDALKKMPIKSELNRNQKDAKALFVDSLNTLGKDIQQYKKFKNKEDADSSLRDAELQVRNAYRHAREQKIFATNREISENEGFDFGD